MGPISSRTRKSRGLLPAQPSKASCRWSGVAEQGGMHKTKGVETNMALDPGSTALAVLDDVRDASHVVVATAEIPRPRVFPRP